MSPQEEKHEQLVCPEESGFQKHLKTQYLGHCFERAGTMVELAPGAYRMMYSIGLKVVRSALRTLGVRKMGVELTQKFVTGSTRRRLP